MLCHPTLSDLFLRRADRVFPGVCLRGGMRSGGDVLDLHRRLPGRSPRRQHVVGSGAFTQHAREDRSSAETLTFGQKTKFQQQKRSCRVGVRGVPSGRPRKANRRSEYTMTKGTDFPVSYDSLSQDGQEAAGLCVASCSAGRRDILGEGSPSSPDFEFRVDGVGTPSAHGPEFSQSFRRILQNSAVGGEISTNGDRTQTQRNFAGTSRIVLVTSRGNVRLLAN